MLRALIAGSAAGLCAFGSFLCLHAVWIVPIWFIVPMGAPVAAAGGATVGWAWHEHRARLPAGTSARALLLLAAAALTLLPAEGIAFLFGPSDPSLLAQAPAGRLLASLVLYLVVATLVGGVGGWLASHSRRRAGITALAAAAFAAGIGHNAPLFGHGWIALKMWTIMLTVTAIAALTLVTLQMRLAAK